MEKITQLLKQWRDGDDGALDQLTPEIQDTLHAIAARYMSGERNNHTLSSTALVNEAFLKLLNERDREWCDRAHFFRAIARMMKNHLIAHAREKQTQKRGGDHQRVFFETMAWLGKEENDFLQLGQGLSRLEKKHPQAAHITELHYFVGMTKEEVAEVLGISFKTVKRKLQFSRAWLQKYLDNDTGAG